MGFVDVQSLRNSLTQFFVSKNSGATTIITHLLGFYESFTWVNATIQLLEQNKMIHPAATVTLLGTFTSG